MKKILWIAMILLAVWMLYGCDTGDSQAHVHEFGELEVFYPASCVSPGEYSRACKTCDYSELAGPIGIDENKHEWGMEECIQGGDSCEEERIYVRRCILCDKQSEPEVQPAGHRLMEWQTVSEATCGKGAVQQRRCMSCGYSEKKETSAPTGRHTYGAGTVISTLGCMQDEIVGYTCSGCGKAEEELISRAQGHRMKNGKCTECGRGYSKGLEISKAGILMGIGNCTDSDIILPEYVTEIYKEAFSNNQNIRSVMLPDSCKVIGSAAFLDCKNLTNVIYPEDVLFSTSGAGYASQFYGCSSLTSITLPSQSTLYDGMWSDCTGLLALEIPDCVNTIGASTFFACYGLKELVIPGTVTDIEEYAFTHCKNVEVIVLEEGIQRLSHKAFCGCKSLQVLHLPASLTALSVDIFAECPALTDVYYNGTEEMWNQLYKNSRWDRDSGDYTVHFSGNPHEFGPWQVVQTATCIRDEISTRSCTCGCGKTQTKVTQTAQGHMLNNGSCTNCGRTESTGLKFALTEDGSGYAVVGIGSCKDTDLIIPATYKGLPVTEIGYRTDAGPMVVTDRAFQNCEQLQSVTLPDSIRVIHAYSFYYCTGLTSVIVPDGVELVGAYAFACCESLTSIQLPDSACTWEDGAFFACSSLLQVDFGGCTEIGESMFSMCHSLTELVIPGSVQTVGFGAFTGCSGLKSVVLEEGVQTLGEQAFDNCKSLETAVIPDSVTGRLNTFHYAGNLHTLYLGSGITELAHRKFYFSLSTIFYNGTQEQWNALEKQSFDWAMSTYTVHCSDGDLVVETEIGKK